MMIYAIGYLVGSVVSGSIVLGGMLAVGDDEEPEPEQPLVPRQSEAVGGLVSTRKSLFDEALRDCSDTNWDGYGAEAANPLSAFWARKLLEVLPSAAGVPDVAFTPRGDPMLEWDCQGKLLSISVGRAGEVRFALRTPARKLTGIEAFSDGTRPRRS